MQPITETPVTIESAAAALVALARALQADPETTFLAWRFAWSGEDLLNPQGDAEDVVDVAAKRLVMHAARTVPVKDQAAWDRIDAAFDAAERKGR